MLKEPVHPAEEYVNVFLLEMLHADSDVYVARKSGSLPTLRGCNPPEFERFRNRLKIMAGLDPVIYPTPHTGNFDIAIDRKLDGNWFECRYVVRLEFADTISNPFVELRAELTSREPGVDPELCL